MPSGIPSLSQLLRLAFGDAPEWLSPEPASGLRVEWAASALEELMPGDLLFISVKASGDKLPELLKRARDLGARAVVLLGQRPHSGASVFSEGLPVAWLHAPSDAREAQRLALMLLLNQRASLIERGARVHVQLSQLAAEGGGLHNLAQAVARLSSRGVVIQDKRLELLAHYPSSTLAGVWEDALVVLCTQDILPEPLRDRKQAGREPGVFTQVLPGGLVRLIAPVISGEMARGYLSLVGIAGELDALDQVILEQGALVCAVEMFRAKAVREAEKRLKGDLLSALLQDDLSPRDARLWVQDMGMDLDQAHAALRFSWDAPNSPSRRRLETLVNGEVARMGLKAFVHGMGVELVCFCQTAGDSVRPDLALTLADAVFEQAEVEYPGMSISCGIGVPAPGLESWRLSFRQAGQALEMARRFKERRPLYYPDLSVYRLLLQIEHSPELAAFLEETLGRLVAHESAAELLHTFEVYFEHNGNLSQTAEALFIHRNTLLYRMERIAAITGLELDHAETRLAVQLALHIRRMMGASPS